MLDRKIVVKLRMCSVSKNKEYRMYLKSGDKRNIVFYIMDEINYQAFEERKCDMKW